MNGVLTDDDYKRLVDASNKLYDRDKMHIYYEGNLPNIQACFLIV